MSDTEKAAREAQAMFEALFPKGHTPLVDTRTPAQVDADRRQS